MFYSRQFDTSCPVLLAVSGGGDSLALLQAAANLKSKSTHSFHVVTVDHALRPEAADEARFVGSVCAELGLPHQTLKLRWEDGIKVSQARARGERYRALCAEARKIGASLILTGHTLDDQLETVFMRLSSGSDLWGLAGMADISPVPTWPEGHGLQIGRPFLSLSGSTLRDSLRATGRSWVEDPSNQQDRFERVRTRRILSGQPQLRRQLLDICLASATQREEQCHRLQNWMTSHLDWLMGGAVRFEYTALKGLSDGDLLRIIQTLLICVSGQTRGADLSKVETLLDRLNAGEGGTLGGCVVALENQHVLITAEQPNDGPGQIVNLDRAFVWAGRILLSGESGSNRTAQWASFSERTVSSHLRALDLPDFAIRRTLPVILSRDGEVEACPHLQADSGYTVSDLGKERACTLVSHVTEFFRKENGIGESFSAQSSTMLQTDE